MKVLITGGAGFIGSHLAEALHNAGHKIIILDNFYSGSRQNLEKIHGSPRVKIVETDVRDLNENIGLFSSVDCVFHLAGLADIVPSIEKPCLYYEVNVTGTVSVLEACRKHSVPKFVYAASSSCYGIPEIFPTPETAQINPMYPYALTKHLGEELALHWGKIYGITTTSLRLFNVYGPRSRTSGAYGAVFGVFLAQKLNDKPFTVVGDGTQTRDFTYVSDVVRAFIAASDVTGVNDVYNVGSGQHQTINKLVKLLGGATVYLPKRPGEPNTTFADIKKIKRQLGWNAVIPFDQGVNFMLENIENWTNAPLWTEESIETATELWFKHLGNAP